MAELTEQHIVAVDLGTSRMALIVAKVYGDDVQIVYYKETASAGIQYSGVSNMVQASVPLAHLIKDAEEALDIKINHAVIGMPKWPVRQESNSGKIQDRHVEVFDFTDNGVSVWCYDIDKSAVRLFNIARIGYVEVTARPWSHQALHRCGEIDIFNMTGCKAYDVCLRLNLRARNLLVEEFPRSKDYISKENDNSWLLTASVYNIAGVARFYMGLANSIEIVSAPELVEYVKEFSNSYLKI
jgi:hypothetical protein